MRPLISVNVTVPVSVQPTLLNMSLNPEPALPDEREAQDLAPKSYAEAAGEAISELNRIEGNEEDQKLLNGVSEAADPEERKAQNLPPKSYAAAAEEAISDHHSVDTTNSDDTLHNDLAEPADPEERKAHNLPPKSYAAAAEEGLPQVNGTDGVKHRVAHINMKENGRIRIPSEDEVEEYEGEGQDNSPRTPVKHAHHLRRKSVQSNGSNGSPKRSSNTTDGMYEKHADGNGHTLTTVKSPADDEKDRRMDKSPKKRPKEGLVAGRQAGAGWERSK